jgi:hypothetical protein
MFSEQQLRNATTAELISMVDINNPEIAEMSRRLEELQDRIDLLAKVIDSWKAKLDSSIG